MEPSRETDMVVSVRIRPGVVGELTNGNANRDGACGTELSLQEVHCKGDLECVGPYLVTSLHASDDTLNISAHERD
jgi:hypothetical protein